MIDFQPTIDPFLFEMHFDVFVRFVEYKGNEILVSFSSHPYIKEEEGYKYEIYEKAHKTLSFENWTTDSIGTGIIIEQLAEAIEIPGNNLVSWQARYGEDSRPQNPLYESRGDAGKVRQIEQAFFQLYRSENNADSLDKLISIFGRRYPLIAYLFFIKDRSRYLPIAPTYFDQSFKSLGADFITSHQCSWENYSTFIRLIGDIRVMLEERLTTEVTLLDAHSFTWMLSNQMARENILPDVKEYLEFDHTEREAIVKARIGQGKFRDGLLNYWKSCAVTGCTEIQLLIASHIKPWSESSNSERINIYNGLLLSPNLDSCFDSGYISFDTQGKIMISPNLKESDRKALGINEDMRLSNLKSDHRKFLEYHRENIFQK